MRFFVIPLLLAAAANAEVFQFVGQQSQTALYGVRGGVTVGVQKLTGEKTALEYNGTLALQQVREGEYLAKFTNFVLEKFDKINRNINDETFANLKPEEQRLVKTIRDQGIYEHEMQKPVRFFMKEGKVVRFEAEKGHQQWSLNVFRGVITLLQNQVRKPGTLAVPAVEYTYEDGIAGDCMVQYHIQSQPEHGSASEVFNVTKTHNFKDCRSRPVYLHLKETQRGCAGVCDNHKPENFLDQYEEEQTDFELKPTPGCPVNQQRQDTLTTVQSVAKYNVSHGLLDGVRGESADVYRLFGGEIQVFTRLQLRLRGTQGPKVEQPQNVQTYTTLQQRLPETEEKELDIPLFALMKEHSKHQQYPQYFGKHFDAIIRELRQIKDGQKQNHNSGKQQQAFDTPAYMVELIQAVSGMTEEELKQTMPSALHQQSQQSLSEEQQLRRQIWLEIVAKAGSKASVKTIVRMIQNKILSHSEIRRTLQDISGFQSYPDTEMIEQLLDLCMNSQGLTGTGKATACVAAGKMISKGCDSKVYKWAQMEHQHKQGQQQQQQQGARNGKYESFQGKQMESEAAEYQMTMGQLAIKSELRCTPEKLQHYVQRLSQGLKQSSQFKQAVAYINGLAQIQKPEVLPELIEYVEGTAQNIHQLREQGEEQREAVEFVRRVAILSLRSVASKYPKEVNPIVRVVYLNTTESVQTRLAAFDIWMNTQPAQWEVEKVMQVANKDSSLELTHYVYTALKTAMQAEEPCYQLLAQRIRAAWSQIRPLDFGMKFSQLRSASYYEALEDFGIRGIWKVISSNSTLFPTFAQGKVEQFTGPYMSTLFGGDLLVKGGEKMWEKLVGQQGLLERVAHAFGNQMKSAGGHFQHQQQQGEQLFSEIAGGMNLKKSGHQETPKAVLMWKLFSGEAIIPIDAEIAREMQQELLQTITKYGKQGVSGHYVRVLVPSKVFQVEPSTIGFPIVHSTIHPIVVSVRYENVQFNYGNIEGRTLPQLLEVSGTIQPTVLSLHQSRVFVAEKEAQQTSTVKISNIKELTARVAFRVSYNHEERRFKLNLKPQFERVFHSGHCTQLQLTKNTILDEEPQSNAVDYTKCVKSLQKPIHKQQKIGGQKTGMTLNLVGESHQTWSGLPMMGSEEVRQNGFFGAILARLANKEMKHHSISLYLEADQQQPINEWNVVIDMDSNIEALSKISLHQQAQNAQKVKVQYKHREHEQLNTELQQVIRKVESLLQQNAEEIQGTTVEKQLLVKIEGRYQGQPKRTIKVAMKKIYNLEKTEQKYALAAEVSGSQKGLELFSQVSYPKIGSPFKYDPTFNGKDERMNGTLIAKIQGQEEQMYRVNFEAGKSDEQRQESELQWYEVQCLAEQKAGKTMGDACKKAILKDNSLDRMQMTIKFPSNVSPMMKEYAKKALTAIKYEFYPQMQSEFIGHRQQQQGNGEWRRQNEINVSLNTTRQSAWSLLHNVEIEMPRETVRLSNIRLPGLRPVHMQLTTKEQLEHVVAGGEFGSVCGLGEQSVRTYDNVTFGLDVKSGCEYLLTRDQSGQRSDFTVTFQVVDGQIRSKKIRIQLGQSLIELLPFRTSENVFGIIVNGAQQQLRFGKSLVFEYGSGKRVFINAVETSNPHHPALVHVYTESKELRVLFDGHSAQTIVANKYKGQVNGICGDNDNEQSHEFIGPNGHEYQHSNEFIASYGIGQGCQTPLAKTETKLMEKLEEELKQIRQREAIKGDRMRQQMRERSMNHGQQWQEQMEEEFYGNAQQLYMQGSQQQWGQQGSYQGGKNGDESQEDRQVLKTAVSIEHGKICFSAEPVPACKEGYHKEGVLRTERVESICLKRSSEYATEALKDIRKGQTVDTSALEQHKVGRLFTMLNIPRCVRRN